MNNKRTLVLCKELCGFGKIVKEEKGHGRDEHSRDSFENEDPSPAREAANAVHFADAKSQNAAECSGDGGGREEERLAKLNFFAAVPHCQIVLLVSVEIGCHGYKQGITYSYTGKQAGFSYS